MLGIAAVAALVLSNSAWAPAYFRWLSTPGELRIGTDALVLSKPLLVWVNDLWMAVFFFLVGLEIKREAVEGELSTRQQAMLPAAAALGGMVVPALIYAAFNWSDAVALRGWAIPAATDIAFAIGIVMLLGRRVPASLKVFLTAVAIIDDLGAIVIIAIFYTDHLSVTALAGAGLGIAALVLLRRAGVTRPDVYILFGLLIWLAVLKSGVHATLAGVITAMAIPMRTADGRSPAQELEHGLHPWVAFGILPVFAFVNAGVSLQGVTWSTLLLPVPMGIAAGLLVGKSVGVFGTVWLLVRCGIAQPPQGATWTQFLGTAVLCGIGFTMSLFIGGLAFEGQAPELETQLKIGVLFGSVTSGLLGALILVRAARHMPAVAPASP